MYNERKFVVCRDPAKCFGKGVKHFWAALAPKGQAHCEIVSTLPEDAEEMPVIGVDREDLESAGDIRLGQPGSWACDADK